MKEDRRLFRIDVMDLIYQKLSNENEEENVACIKVSELIPLILKMVSIIKVFLFKLK